MRRRPFAVPLFLLALATAGATPASAVNVLQATAWAPVGGQGGASFGHAVAPAGDVDGDGYSDVIVGAPGFDTGQANAGAAYLFRGGPAGSAATPAWTFLGAQTGAALGSAVAPAGDVNGDGYADVLVGLPLYNAAGGSDHGRVLLFLGGAAGLPASASQTLTGSVAGGQFGYSLATAGDVNGDGYDDVVIGAPLAVNTVVAEGAAYVYLGGPGGLTGPAWTKFGGTIAALLGYAVSGAGDVDADGFADVVVGAPGKSVSFAADGAAYVYRGSAGGVLASASASLHGASDSAAFGAAVSLAGDTNADGYADVLVGSPNRKLGGVSYGTATLYAGAPGGLGAALWSENGTTARENYGVCVATAGDLNADGYPDYVIGADRWPQPSERRGRVEVYLGGPAAPALPEAYFGIAVGQALGIAAATAGDVDGDGFAELVIGEPGTTVFLAGEGRVSQYRGSALPPAPAPGWPKFDAEAGAGFGAALAGGVDPYGTLSTILFIGAPTADPGFGDAGRVMWTTPEYPVANLFGLPALTGSSGGSQLGRALARAGDVNGDRIDDLLAANPKYTNGEGFEGLAQVFLGSGNGLVAPAAWSRESNVVNAQFGTAVGAGDFNGDGIGDVAVSSLYSGSGSDHDGFVQVFPGSLGGLPPAPTWTSPPLPGDTYFGVALACGDWDGDGYSDLAVGSPNESHGQAGEGRVHVFFGGPGGLAATPAWSLEINIASGQFGHSLANAGDVDGDGVSDLLVGALTAFDGTHPNSSGEAWLFFGDRSRAVPTLQRARRFVSDVPTVSFSWAMAGIGDIDRDGYGDFLVSAPQYANGQTNEGRVSLYRGSAEGGEELPWLSIESNVAEAWYGWALAAAGDVNQDGWPDFAVGAPFQGTGGATYLYQGGGQPTFRRTGLIASGHGLPIGGSIGSPNDLFIIHTTRSPAGRARSRTELHVATQGEAWTGGTHLVVGPYDAGPPAAGTFGSSITYAFSYAWVTPGIAYRVRTRSVPLSPYFAASLWAQPLGAETADLHFRVAGAVVGAPGGDPAAVPGAGARVALRAVEPSPFRDATRIAYALPRAGAVALDVYDARGRHVRRLAAGPQAAGEHAVAFDGRDERGQAVAGGVYFVVLDLDGERDVRKLVRLP